MNTELIHIQWGQDNAAERVDGVCLLIVPEKAIEEPGYIKGMHSSGSTNKHELHALAQTAYYQYQDDELELEHAAGRVLVEHQAETQIVEAGMILFRDGGGAIKALVNGDVPVRKLLETAYRFCTRWVRLDI